MRLRSRLMFPAVAVIAAMSLAGCGSSEDTAKSDDDAAPKAAISLDGATLVKDGQLTVCSDMPYKPFEFEEGGKTTGFDYEVVSAMGKQLGLNTEFVTTPFDSIIPALAAGNCDMIASAMTITPERAEKVLFTEPYFDADQSLLVLKENADKYKTLADLKGQDIGVQVETTGATYAEENKPEGAKIISFGTGDEIFPALVSKDVQAALQDLPVNAYRARTAPDQFVVTETFKTGEQYGFAVAKEAEALHSALDKALAAVKDDGTWDEIYSTWFGEKK
ncbi:MAG TPA: basic amino acid ABC transporter substrate-binding protein [Microthrixaceae bacterium]|nr:basic amino acid ABC transporter substrate-binding protein [Microthrixaceae bacterium]